MIFLKKLKEQIKENRAANKRFKEQARKDKKHFALIEADKIHEIPIEDVLIGFVGWCHEHRLFAFEDLSSKPLSQQYVKSIFDTLPQIYEKCFEGFYYDGGCDEFCPDAERTLRVTIEGLDIIGYTAISEVLKKADKIYEANKEFIEKSGWEVLSEKNLWTGLIEEFIELYPITEELDKVMGQYILENQQYFKGEYLKNQT